jgi:hypothetical protein
LRDYAYSRNMHIGESRDYAYSPNMHICKSPDYAYYGHMHIWCISSTVLLEYCTTTGAVVTNRTMMVLYQAYSRQCISTLHTPKPGVQLVWLLLVWLVNLSQIHLVHCVLVLGVHTSACIIPAYCTDITKATSG